MPTDVDDGNYEEDFTEGGAAAAAPSPTAKAKPVPAASPRPSSQRLTFKGLEGVSIPAAALHPQLVVTTDASGEERHEHTLTVTRSKRGVVALPKSTTPSRIAANLDTFGFTLDAADLAALAALGERPASRIVKGLPLMVAGQEHWSSHWDEEWERENVQL